MLEALGDGDLHKSRRAEEEEIDDIDRRGSLLSRLIENITQEMKGFHLGRKRRGVAGVTSPKSPKSSRSPRARKLSFFSRGRRSSDDAELQSIDSDAPRECPGEVLLRSPSPQLETIQSSSSFQAAAKEPSQDDARGSSPSNLERSTDSDVRCSQPTEVEQSTDDHKSLEAVLENGKGGNQKNEVSGQDNEVSGQNDETTENFTSTVTAFLEEYANGTPQNFCVMPPQIGSLWNMTSTAEPQEVDEANEIDTNGVKKTENATVESAPVQSTFCSMQSLNVNSLWNRATNIEANKTSVVEVTIVDASGEADTNRDPPDCPSPPKDSLQRNSCVMPSQIAIGSLWNMFATAEPQGVDEASEINSSGVKDVTIVDASGEAVKNCDPQDYPSDCPSPPKDTEEQNDIIEQLELQCEQSEDTPVATAASVKEDEAPQEASAAEVEAPSNVLAPTSDTSIHQVIYEGLSKTESNDQSIFVFKNQQLPRLAETESNDEGMLVSTKLSKDDARATSEKSNVAALIDGVREQYQGLQKSGSVRVRFLDTYQGRLPGSTNGCTVIAPLTCIQYFTSPDQNFEGRRGGIPDELINQVIDDESPPVLAAVRGKLNLGEDTFIVPSDVHDYLIEAGLLSSGQFVAVCGGDILNDEHLEQFKSSLLVADEDRDARKVAAAFFFKGHVVAVHVVKSAEEGLCVDLIDSLPDASNWITNEMKRRLREALASYEEREPTQDTSRSEDMELDSDGLPHNAVRIRTDLEHFNTLIRYYACNKFSEEERDFIDTNLWEDENCEVDCRVFQAFIWSEAV